jgi:hypothetical protein
MTCPACGQGQLDPGRADAAGMVACDHCGRRAYAGYVAEATYLTTLREQQDRRLGWLVDQVRGGAPAPDAATAKLAYAWPAPAQGAMPQAPSRAPSAGSPLLLVLGTGLLVIAALVFVAVVWDQIGAGGQALALSTIVAGTAVLAVRLRGRLASTAEALAVTSLAVLTIELLSAPHLGILPFRVPDWGGWYQPAAFAVVAAAGLVAARTYGLKAWNVLGWLAIVPTTAFLALAVLRHLNVDHPAHASGYGALVAIVVGLTLLRIQAVFPRLSRSTGTDPLPLVSGTVLLAGALAAAPLAATGHGARGSWLIAGLAGSTVTVLVGRFVRPSGARGHWWDAGTGLALGMTAALALLPDRASSLGWAAAVAGLGAGVLAAGVLVRRIELGHIAAGAIWASWLAGRVVQYEAHVTSTLADQTVLVAAVAMLVLFTDAWLNHRPWLDWVAAGSGMLATVTAADHGEVHLLEGYTLPAAALLLLAGILWHRERAGNSLLWCGPGTAMALVPSAGATWLWPWDTFWSDSTAETTEHLLRLIAVIVAGGLVAVLGARLRWGGLLIPAGLALAITATAQIWATAHVLPTWMVLATVGAALVAAGARLEWLRDQRTRLDDWAERLA